MLFLFFPLSYPPTIPSSFFSTTPFSSLSLRFQIIVTLQEFLRDNRKQMVLQENLGPSFAVNSVEFKLLSSLTYEYAKKMTALCPYLTSAEPMAKLLFQKSFELYWCHFPAFQTIHDDGFKVLDGKNPVSFKTHVRCQLQRSFINLMRKSQRTMAQNSPHMGQLEHQRSNFPELGTQ